MRERKWFRAVVGGMAWAAVYNALWGPAWRVFMRREWAEAAMSSGRPMPWTPDFWAVWLPLTVPFGVAITAYLADRRRREDIPRAALIASLVIWVPGTVGMIAWTTLSVRVMVIDSAVNLIAVVLASLVAGAVVVRLDTSGSAVASTRAIQETTPPVMD